MGSNLGDRMAKLQGAVDSLADTPDVWVTEVSPVYETDPVDAPEGSEPFLNVVVLLDTTLPRPPLLDRAPAIESAFGRQRGEVGNAPRTLDVDLIVVGDRRADDENLLAAAPAGRRARLRARCRGSRSSPTRLIAGSGPVAELLEQVDQCGIKRRDDLALELQ